MRNTMSTAVASQGSWQHVYYEAFKGKKGRMKTADIEWDLLLAIDSSHCEEKNEFVNEKKKVSHVQCHPNRSNKPPN